VVYCPRDVQYYCNSVANAGGRGEYKDVRVNPVYGKNPYTFEVHVFTKQAKYD